MVNKRLHIYCSWYGILSRDAYDKRLHYTQYGACYLVLSVILVKLCIVCTRVCIMYNGVFSVCCT